MYLALRAVHARALTRKTWGAELSRPLWRRNPLTQPPETIGRNRSDGRPQSFGDPCSLRDLWAAKDASPQSLQVRDPGTRVSAANWAGKHPRDSFSRLMAAKQMQDSVIDGSVNVGVGVQVGSRRFADV
jgi:hypothetical protein